MAFSFPDLGKSVTAGFKYYGQFMKELVWASKGNHTDATAALVAIAAKHSGEIFGGAADITATRGLSLLLNPDAFKESRQMLHDYEARFGKH